MPDHHPDHVEVVPRTDGWHLYVKADHVFLIHETVHMTHETDPAAQRQMIRTALLTWQLEIPGDAAWVHQPDGSYQLPVRAIDGEPENPLLTPPGS